MCILSHCSPDGERKYTLPPDPPHPQASADGLYLVAADPHPDTPTRDDLAARDAEGVRGE